MSGGRPPACLNVCRGVLPYSGDAEDACQEALLNVATKIGSWNGRGRFTTWMHVVALNSARTTYRKLKNQAVPTDFEGGHHDRPDPRTTSVIAGTRLDLLEAMETIEKEPPAVRRAVAAARRLRHGLRGHRAAHRRAPRHREGADPPRPEARATPAPGRVMTTRRVMRRGALAVAAGLLAGCSAGSEASPVRVRACASSEPDRRGLPVPEHRNHDCPCGRAGPQRARSSPTSSWP